MGTSSPNYRFSADVRVIADADTRLVAAAARPAPGTTARCHSLARLGPGQNVTVPATVAASTPAWSSRTADAPAVPCSWAGKKTTSPIARFADVRDPLDQCRMLDAALCGDAPLKAVAGARTLLAAEIVFVGDLA
ncbi:hypothetical protein Shyhy01_18540 [Streptomyces hygroscopicus subsp. hygroscopicus]|nr:hypothetical protein Shyhy01_18540 [Streptomyces hygroscopicus subsp. hygroscopicus]